MNQTDNFGLPPQNNANGFCTVGNLLDNITQFGLPHFQRGSVWSKEAMGKLLESLTLDTPCGSIILWKPQDLKQNYSTHATTVE